MKIQRIAAFCDGTRGGNPAGVMLLDAALKENEMRKIAAQVGYSETVFAVPSNKSKEDWQVRYFSPESEVPFCGHATIALGAALGERFGKGSYNLSLNHANISVAANRSTLGMTATLISPPTNSRKLELSDLESVLSLFNLELGDLDPKLASARIYGGAEHIVIALKNRNSLASMQYSLDEGRAVMRQFGIVTIMLVFVEDDQRFSVRNAFASGGVLEDPATGAAAAAFAGYLRDIEWPHEGKLQILQGYDMGQPSIINAELTDDKGSAVRLTGLTRIIG